MNYPTGKILFVVSLRGYNDIWLLPEIKKTILEDGYDGVALKVLHGFRYSHAIEDMTEFFDKLRGKVQLYGWQWNLLEQPEKEAIWARKAVNEFRLDGFEANPEATAKDNPDGMRFYAKELKERFPNEAVGLCSYRYPSLHPEFPWDCLEHFDYHAPQVYWILKHNPAKQLQDSYNELIALKDMPVIPVGSAYTSPKYDGWKPTPADLKEFDAKCKSMGLMGCQWFTWRGAKPLGLLPVLKELNWEVDPPEPPPVNCDELVAEAVETVSAEYEEQIAVIQQDHVKELLEIDSIHKRELAEAVITANNTALENLIKPHKR